MAAGISSRMKKSSITKNMTKKQINQSNSRVKGYIQVAEGKEPLIFYLIKNSINAGVKEFYIIVSEKSQARGSKSKSGMIKYHIYEIA